MISSNDNQFQLNGWRSGRLLDEAVYHSEHMRLGLRERTPVQEVVQVTA